MNVVPLRAARPLVPMLFVFSLGFAYLIAGNFLLGGSPLCSAQDQPTRQKRVLGVETSGNRTVSANTILGLVKTRSGRALDLDLIESDVRSLNRSGKFVEVRPRMREVQGGVVVVFEVVERPMLQYVKYLGNKRYRDKDLAKEVDLKKGDPLSPHEVETARGLIEAFYKEKGFNRTQVTVLEGNRPTDQGAVYLINEGLTQKIRWTNFKGNSAISTSLLKTQIQSKPGIAWMFKGQFDRKKVDEDVTRITSFYRSLGYFGAKVSRELDFNESQQWVTITFFVREGPRYQVRHVSFDGNQNIDTSQLSTDLNIDNGSEFDQAKLNRDVARIEDAYGQQGYIFAKVQADPRFLEEPGKLDLVYKIVEGDRYRIGEINVQIQGENAHTRRNVVLNRISLRPGDIADIRQLRASKVRLQRSGLFETDPGKGIVPELKFQRRNDEHLARQRENGPRVRGQSPESVRDLYIYEEWHHGAWRRVARPALTPQPPVVDNRQPMPHNDNTMTPARRYP